MLGARIKSWVEAQLSRAKKRKQKPAKCENPVIVASTDSRKECRNTIITLSSPESAYSTGYSTDGTTPGVHQREPENKIIIQKPPPVETIILRETKSVYPAISPKTPKKVLNSHQRSESVGSKWVNATPSPRRRCRIKTNPWLNGAPSPSAARRHAQNHSPRKNTLIIKRPSDSSDEDTGSQIFRETAILSDASSDFDTGLDGGDEEESCQESSPGRRRTRRRPLWRRPPSSAGPTPLRMRRRNRASSTSQYAQNDPFVEADREAEQKYKDLIREAEHLLVSVSRGSIEPPHNPRVRLLRESDFCAPRPQSPSPRPDRSPVTGFIRPKPLDAARHESPVSPLVRVTRPIPPPPPPVAARKHMHHIFSSAEDRPMSEPPKRKAYVENPQRNILLVQTLQELKKSLVRHSVLLSAQTRSITKLDTTYQ